MVDAGIVPRQRGFIPIPNRFQMCNQSATAAWPQHEGEIEMNTKALYARYRKLLELEEAADIAFDKLDVERAVLLRCGVAPDNAIPAGFVKARDTRDALFEKRTDLEETFPRLRRIDSLDQLDVNWEIAAKRADMFDDAGEYVRLVAAQARAFIMDLMDRHQVA